MEFKFKVWDVENKEMLDLQDLQFNDITGEITIRTTMYSDYFTTDQMILLPYTGLKDKEGKEIYLGDILQLDEIGRKMFGGINGPLDREYQLVGFNDGGFMTGHNYSDPETMNTYLWIVRDNAKVVGNKYENPDLLTKDLEYYEKWLNESIND